MLEADLSDVWVLHDCTLQHTLRLRSEDVLTRCCVCRSWYSFLAMQRGGRTTYFGPLGQESSLLVSYLQAVPGQHYC